jgi:hypothetical protein
MTFIQRFTGPKRRASLAGVLLFDHVFFAVRDPNNTFLRGPRANRGLFFSIMKVK